MITVRERRTKKVIRVINEKVPENTDIFSVLYKFQIEVHQKHNPYIKINEFHIGDDHYIKQTSSTYKLRDIILDFDGKSQYSVGHFYNMSVRNRIDLVQYIQYLHEREDKQ